MNPRQRVQDSRPVVELIRKNTLTNYQRDQQQQQQQPHGRHQTEHASTLPPGASIPGAYPGGEYDFCGFSLWGKDGVRSTSDGGLEGGDSFVLRTRCSSHIGRVEIICACYWQEVLPNCV